MHISSSDVSASGALTAFSSTHSRKQWSCKVMVEQGHQRTSKGVQKLKWTLVDPARNPGRQAIDSDTEMHGVGTHGAQPWF